MAFFNQENDSSIEAFRFGVDDMPMWFVEMVASGQAKLLHQSHRNYDKYYCKESIEDFFENENPNATLCGINLVGYKILLGHGDWLVKKHDGELMNIDDIVFSNFYKPKFKY